jgi:hypothetical protein
MRGPVSGSFSDAREYGGLTDSTGTSRFENVEAGSYGVFAKDPDYGSGRAIQRLPPDTRSPDKDF